MQSVLILAYTSVTATATWNLLPTVTLPNADHAYVLGPWNEDGTRFMTAADDIYYHTDGAATGTYTTANSSLMDDIVEFGFSNDIDDALNNKSNFHVHSFIAYRGDDTCFGLGIDFNDNLNVAYHAVFFVLNDIIKERIIPENITHPPPLDYAAAITQTNTDDMVYIQSGWEAWGQNTQLPYSFITLYWYGPYLDYAVSSADGSTLAAIADGDAIVGNPTSQTPFSVEESTDHNFKAMALNDDGSRLIAATINSILVYNRTDTTFTITHRHSTEYEYNKLDLQQCSFSANEQIIACLAIAYDHRISVMESTPENCVAVFTVQSINENVNITLTAALTFPTALPMYSIADTTYSNLFIPQTPTIKTKTVDSNAEFTDVSVYPEGSIIAATYVETGNPQHTKVALMKSSTPVPPPPSPPPPSKSSGSSAGMVVGVTVGAVALIGGVGYLIYLTSARRSQSAETLLLYM